MNQIGATTDGTVLDILLALSSREIDGDHNLLATRIAGVRGFLLRTRASPAFLHARYSAFLFLFLAAFPFAGGGLRLTTSSCLPSGEGTANVLARNGSWPAKSCGASLVSPSAV